MEKIRFAVIGVNHGHIYGQVQTLTEAGAEFASYYAPEPALQQEFGKKYPDVKLAREAREILEDESIHVVTSAGIPNERAALGIQVMRHGKDYLVDKPGFTTLGQLNEARRVQAETGRIYSIWYAERLANPGTVRAAQLAHEGAIGGVVQTIGLGPHRANLQNRPPWFFVKEQYGGILADIASHQFDQYLYFTNSRRATVVAAQVGNYGNPEHPELEDFGDALLQGDGGNGYVRVDWFTPSGLPSWGDGRLTVLGTEGYIEVRKNIDIEGRPGANHLFIADKAGTRYIDCSDVKCPYGEQFLYDVRHRTETAMTQEHCFLASELALRAQGMATRLGNLAGTDKVAK